jgi:CDP-diacylglycerol--glycerol-3-phosphate 3-phosphatidyltransferase
MQRPERVTLLSAPQALFGLALGGWVLMFIVTLLTVTAWITAVQRIMYVHRVTQAMDHAGGDVSGAAAPAPLAGAARGPGTPS